jgi:hypothetical protein
MSEEVGSSGSSLGTVIVGMSDGVGIMITSGVTLGSLGISMLPEGAAPM